jgi:hypothetical protein
MKNGFLAVVRDSIPYIKELRPYAKSVAGCIVMQQLDYWFDKQGNSFYKFMEPCKHQLYKEGDSWCEELGVSAEEFVTAFEKIGIRYRTKTAFEGAEKVFLRANTAGEEEEVLYCCYSDKRTGLTHYFRNDQLVDGILDAMLSRNGKLKGRQEPPVNRDDRFTVNRQPRITVNRDDRVTVTGDPGLQKPATPDYPYNIMAENTPETTPETTLNTPLPPTTPRGEECESAKEIDPVSQIGLPVPPGRVESPRHPKTENSPLVPGPGGGGLGTATRRELTASYRAERASGRIVAEQRELLGKRFDALWALWPGRRGSKVGESDARRLYMGMAPEARGAFERGVPHYAAYCARTGSYAMDMRNFINQQAWVDYQEEVKVEEQALQRNGDRPSKAAKQADALTRGLDTIFTPGFGRPGRRVRGDGAGPAGATGGADDTRRLPG